MLSLIYTVLVTTRNVVHEKERKLKESMKMMGLRSWVHWAAWFSQSLIMMLVSVVIICIEIKLGNILECGPYIFQIHPANFYYVFEVKAVAAFPPVSVILVLRLLLHGSPL
jgi:hypothetical protein